MLNLILNENMKIYRRIRTWILVILLFLIILGAAILVDTHLPQKDPNWRVTLQQSIVQNNKIIQQGSKSGVPANMISQLKIQNAQNQYQLSHNMANPLTGWQFSSEFIMTGGNFLLIVFVAIVAGDIVASEFSQGTIKLLLTRPRTRYEILLSKFLALVIFSFFLTLCSVALSILIGFIFFGTNGYSIPTLIVTSGGNIASVSLISFFLMIYGLNTITVIAIASIAFMISTIFRSSAVAIAISLITLFVGSTISSLLQSYSWDKYLIFSNLGIAGYLTSGPTLPGLTLTFSLIVLFVYVVVMIALSLWIFKRRDVALT